MRRRYYDRHEGGRVLAQRLVAYSHRPDVLVLALPRGGVPVGFEVARELHARLDIFLVRKLGVPGHEELAMGALASGGARVINEEIVASLGIAEEVIDEVSAREARELQRREEAYRGGRPAPEVAGRTVILVDDGLATGATMRAAAEALKRRGAGRIVVAVPVAAAESCEKFRHLVDEVVCPLAPTVFRAVGEWYEDFSQTTDEEVAALLHEAAREDAFAGNSTQ